MSAPQMANHEPPHEGVGPASPASPETEFVWRILGLDTGDAARLKRAAGKSLSEARDCLWFYRVVPGPLRPEVEACFLVATLLCAATRWFRAQQQKAEQQEASDFRPGAAGSFGASMARLKSARSREAAATDQEGPIDRRFRILLDAGLERGPDGELGGELPYRLRQAVRLLDSHDVAVDWAQLIRDLRYWTHPERRVQKRWAADFYDRHAPTDQPTTESPGAGPDTEKDDEHVD